MRLAMRFRSLPSKNCQLAIIRKPNEFEGKKPKNRANFERITNSFRLRTN